MKLTWEDVAKRERICLYAGDIYPRPVDMSHLVGLSLTRSDEQHIIHDVRKPIPLPDNSVDSYQAEDVFEHVPYDDLPAVFAEIYRVLKPGGLFRLSVPDYRCDVLRDRTEKDDEGNLVFDPGGGGTRNNPGHVWFPIYETVSALFINSEFDFTFYHWYTPDGNFELFDIDHSLAYVARTPDHDKRVQNPRRPMSIVVDGWKQDA